MIITLEELISRLDRGQSSLDTNAADAIWIKLSEGQSAKTAEFRSPNEAIVHVYLNEKGEAVGIEIFP